MLIKTVAYAVPTSSMSRFEFLKKWSEQVDAAGSKFWWGQQKSEGTAQWRSWGSSTEAKLEGGLGFRKSFSVQPSSPSRSCLEDSN